MDDFEKSQDQPIMDDGDAQLDTEPDLSKPRASDRRPNTESLSFKDKVAENVPLLRTQIGGEKIKVIEEADADDRRGWQRLYDDEKYRLEDPFDTIDEWIYNLRPLPCFRPEEFQLEHYDGHILEATCDDPILFCLGCAFPSCFACYQRTEILYDVQKEYTCCQGAYGKFQCCDPLWRNVPGAAYAGLCIEACFFPTCAIGGNRKALAQYEPVDETPVELLILISGSIMSFCGCFTQWITCLNNGCLNAQQERELVIRRPSKSLCVQCSSATPGQAYKPRETWKRIVGLVCLVTYFLLAVFGVLGSTIAIGTA